MPRISPRCSACPPRTTAPQTAKALHLLIVKGYIWVVSIRLPSAVGLQRPRHASPASLFSCNVHDWQCGDIVGVHGDVLIVGEDPSVLNEREMPFQVGGRPRTIDPMLEPPVQLRVWCNGGVCRTAWPATLVKEEDGFPLEWYTEPQKVVVYMNNSAVTSDQGLLVAEYNQHLYYNIYFVCLASTYSGGFTSCNTEVAELIDCNLVKERWAAPRAIKSHTKRERKFAKSTVCFSNDM